MSYSLATLIIAIVAVVLAWNVLKGIAKTIALVAIALVAAIIVFGGMS
ncbi:hypothetical protein [Altericroceibacterium indicum]|nr:hypothetical protein [Altericroceibacterium indicum]